MQRIGLATVDFLCVCAFLCVRMCVLAREAREKEENG